MGVSGSGLGLLKVPATNLCVPCGLQQPIVILKNKSMQMETKSDTHFTNCFINSIFLSLFFMKHPPSHEAMLGQ